MKVKELIAQLEKTDYDSEVTIAVYDCSGYNDSYSPDDVEEHKGEGYHYTQIGIGVGCATHRKWQSEQNCPVNKLGAEIEKLNEIQKTIEYYREEMKKMEARFSERNRK